MWPWSRISSDKLFHSVDRGIVQSQLVAEIYICDIYFSYNSTQIQIIEEGRFSHLMFDILAICVNMINQKNLSGKFSRNVMNVEC